jgi:tRNA(Ile)-lysidine synthetase-like protein
VLPDLRRKLGDRAEAALFAMLEAARKIVISDEELAASYLADHCQSPAHWRFELSLESNDSKPPHILHETFRQLHARLIPGAPPPAWAWIERMTDLCDKPRGQRVTGPGWPLAERTTQGILLADTIHAGAPSPTELPLNGTTTAFGTTEWRISARRYQGPGSIPPDQGHGRLYVDARHLHPPLSARPPVPGERFQPLGQSRDVDLRGFLHNRKVPIFDRDRLPIIVDQDDQIVCAANIEIANPFKVSPGTSERIEIVVSMG